MRHAMLRVPRCSLLAAALLWPVAAGVARRRRLTVAAASDLQSALPAIASQFEKDTGQKVTLTFGSSGNFFTQIQNGAPFDVFLSADIDYPRRLEAAGLAERGSLYEYATRPPRALDAERLRHRRAPRLERADAMRASAASRSRTRSTRRTAAPRSRRFVTKGCTNASGQVRARREHFAGRAVRPVGQRRRRHPGARRWRCPRRSRAPAPTSRSRSPGIRRSSRRPSSSRRRGRRALARQFIDYLKKPATVHILQSFGFAPAK